MGRGRSKAKQTKIARELKYFTQPTDFNALQQELAQPNRVESPHGESLDRSTDDSEETPQ